jgi:hypothetical protein
VPVAGRGALPPLRTVRRLLLVASLLAQSAQTAPAAQDATGTTGACCSSLRSSPTWQGEARARSHEWAGRETAAAVATTRVGGRTLTLRRLPRRFSRDAAVSGRALQVPRPLHSNRARPARGDSRGGARTGFRPRYGGDEADVPRRARVLHHVELERPPTGRVAASSALPAASSSPLPCLPHPPLPLSTDSFNR